jgi:predicted glycosyltransferase
MQKKGHNILITASKKEITEQLLQKYQFDFINVGAHSPSVIKKIINLPLMIFHTYRAARKFKPDLLLGFGSIRAACTAAILQKPCINFDDTEVSIGQIRLYRPFVRCICTPSCFLLDLGSRQVRFKGYLELAHLHPDRFIPDPAILEEIGLKEKETFIIVRFVTWGATHDIGQQGIEDRIGFVKSLEYYGRVLLTSEGNLPPELRDYKITLSPEKIHDLLSFAALYVGEGGTMASEAAILGTPSVFISSLASRLGNFIELEHRYDLLYSFTDSCAAFEKSREILRNPQSKENWGVKREKMIRDKIDVTAFMMWLVENYPQSFEEMKKSAAS